MDDQTPVTHIEQQHKPFLTLSAKPRVADSRLNSPVVYYGLADNSVCQVDLEKGKIVQKRENTHEGKIGCIRFKEEMLMTGGYDNMLRLYDPRSLQIVHSFQKIPGKFNSVDKTQHILAAACNSNIVFWDLRKMKQRSEFTDSFNGEVTHIRFDEARSTNLLGCSIDGMLNMFDLTQLDEDSAFSWCFKIMESPSYFTLHETDSVLVQTTDHVLYKVQDADHFGKITPNNPESPRHILHSLLASSRYQYCTWSPEEGVIERWEGNFLDRQNGQACSGYINGVPDIQMLTMMGDGVGVFADESGNLFSERFGEEKQVRQEPKTGEGKWEFSKKMVEGPVGPKLDRNGYIIEKPASSFGKARKFRPY